MSLIPRWEYMTDDAKAMTKRIVLSALVLLLSLWVMRELIPWVIVVLLVYWHSSGCRRVVESISTMNLTTHQVALVLRVQSSPRVCH